MTQSLVINGKEYLQSNILASRFGYTGDYIGKLAREEKILGTQIGRQWFVEPESLTVFLAQSDIAKKLRQEELRVQRKLERQLHEEKVKASPRVVARHELMALAQTAIVVCCGLMLGGLGWIASEEKLGVHELASGAKESFAFIAMTVTGADSAVSVFSGDFVAASVESLPLEKSSVSYETALRHEEEQLVFTSLPEFPVRESIASSTVANAEGSAVGGFSDEVRLVINDDGSEVIVPVFREGGLAQQFLLVPVNANDQ